VGGDPQPGGTPALFGDPGENGSGNGAAAGNLVGLTDDPVDAPETPRVPSQTPPYALADPPAPAPPPDLVERNFRASQLTLEPAPEPAQVEGGCPACGAPEPRVLFSATDRLYATTTRFFQIVECRKCRLIRLDPQPSPLELRDYYPPNYWFVPEATAADRLEQWYRRFVLRDHLRFVERALAESEEQGIVLDVGCGGGLFLQMLAERRNVKVVGLDFSLDAANVAWRRAGVPAVCATLSRPPLAPESCAAVTMFHVLEHLYDPASYLDSARQLLRPDGRLILQVPNAACWQFLLFGERWNGIDVPRHLIDFRLSDVDSLLDNCGFEVLRHKHFSLRDNPAGMATSLAPSLDPMARRLRQVPETPRQRLWKDLLYLGLVGVSLPFTLFEAACRAGSTIMVEARKKS
jgi:SAM-dependent methyltransferase